MWSSWKLKATCKVNQIPSETSGKVWAAGFGHCCYGLYLVK